MNFSVLSRLFICIEVAVLLHSWDCISSGPTQNGTDNSTSNSSRIGLQLNETSLEAPNEAPFVTSMLLHPSASTVSVRVLADEDVPTSEPLRNIANMTEGSNFSTSTIPVQPSTTENSISSPSTKVPSISSTPDSQEQNEGPDIRIESRQHYAPAPKQTPQDAVPLTEEDKQVRKDWGGSCTEKDWQRCLYQKKLKGRYWEDGVIKYNRTQFIDCKYMHTWCMRNGWTVTDCTLLCMSECSKELLTNFDKFVKSEGTCDFPF